MVDQETLRYQLFHTHLKENFSIWIGMRVGQYSCGLTFPNDPQMIAQQAQFLVLKNGIYMSNLGSPNASAVNGHPVPYGVAIKLRIFDLIKIGAQYFVFTDGNQSLEQIYKYAGQRTGIPR